MFCFVVAAASEGFYVLSTTLGLLVPWGRWLCAHSPHRLFTSTDALDLCKFLTFLPTETVIKTNSHYFLSCFTSKLLSFEDSLGISGASPLDTHRFWKTFSLVPPTWPLLPDWVSSPWCMHSSPLPLAQQVLILPNCLPQQTVRFLRLLCTVFPDVTQASPRFCSCPSFFPTPLSF